MVLLFSYIKKVKRKIKNRKGCGPGSKRGKICGHSDKGQGERNTKPRLGF